MRAQYLRPIATPTQITPIESTSFSNAPSPAPIPTAPNQFDAYEEYLCHLIAQMTPPSARAPTDHRDKIKRKSEF